MEIFPDVLGAADVLVALLESDAGRFSVPSKVLNYLCGGRPVLLSAPTDNLSARLVEEAGAGVCAPAGNREAFLRAAHRLRHEPQLCAQFGGAGRGYAETTFNISAIADRFESTIVRAIARRRERKGN